MALPQTVTLQPQTLLPQGANVYQTAWPADAQRADVSNILGSADLQDAGLSVALLVQISDDGGATWTYPGPVQDNTWTGGTLGKDGQYDPPETAYGPGIPAAGVSRILQVTTNLLTKAASVGTQAIFS